jgi:putative PIN family toxin of toxin-antitoxin system
MQTHPPQLKFVVDTNVWIEAIAGRDRTRKNDSMVAIKKAYNEGLIVTNDNAIKDLSDALFKKLRKNEISNDTRLKIMSFYREHTVRASEKTPYSEYSKTYAQHLEKCEDASDRVFLALAHEQKAPYIITNDGKHLLGMGKYLGASMKSSQAFILERLPEHSAPRGGKDARSRGGMAR